MKSQFKTRCSQEQQLLKSSTSRSFGQRTKKRILVVDDEEEITRMIAESLWQIPFYDVETTTSSQEAFEKASTQSYDLLISDVQMPSLGGESLFLCLGLDPENCFKTLPRPPLLLISGMLDDQELRRSLKFIGGYHYLSKPFNSTTLIRAVADAIRPRLF